MEMAQNTVGSIPKNSNKPFTNNMLVVSYQSTGRTISPKWGGETLEPFNVHVSSGYTRFSSLDVVFVTPGTARVFLSLHDILEVLEKGRRSTIQQWQLDGTRIAELTFETGRQLRSSTSIVTEVEMLTLADLDKFKELLATVKNSQPRPRKGNWNPVSRFLHPKAKSPPGPSIPLYIEIGLPSPLEKCETDLRNFVLASLKDTIFELSKDTVVPVQSTLGEYIGFCEEGNPNINLLRIGSDLSCCFDIFIRVADFEKVFGVGEPSYLHFVKKTMVVSAHDVLVGKDAGWDKYTLNTSNSITKSKLKAAADYANRKLPRKPTQKVAMHNTSATDLAEKLLLLDKEKAKGQSEWLHVSAFSFWGIGQITTIDTSQHKENLIWGTCAANTSMMIAESFVKRDALVLLANIGGYGDHDEISKLIMESADSENCEVKVSEHAIPWFAPILEYEYRCPDKGLGHDVYFIIGVEPFRRFTPLRIEALLSEKVQTLLRTAQLESQRFGAIKSNLTTLVVSDPDATALLLDDVDESDSDEAEYFQQPHIA